MPIERRLPYRKPASTVTLEQCLAESFRIVRRSRKLSRADVAKLAKCAQRTVDRLEDGLIPAVRIQSQIARVLGVPLWRFYRHANGQLRKSRG